MPQGWFFPTGQGLFLSFNKLLWVVTLICIIVVLDYSFLRSKQFTAHSTLLVHVWLDLAVTSSWWDLIPCYLRSTRPWSSVMSSSPDIFLPIGLTGCYRINQTNPVNSDSIPNTAVTCSLCVSINGASTKQHLYVNFFCLEHAGELCIIILRRKKGKSPYKHTHAQQVQTNTRLLQVAQPWPKLKLSLAPGQKGNWLTSR
jgi:hypothetical protein